MSPTDNASPEELESPDAATPDFPPTPPRPVIRSGPPRQKRSKRRIYIAGGVVVVAIGFLVYKGVTSAFVYFKTAQQAVADRASLGTTTFQIEGTVVKGTEQTNSRSGVTFFEISSGKTRVAVDNTGVAPQLFGPGIPVVLVGHFTGTTDVVGGTNEYVFSSDDILVKHTNAYIAAHPNRVKSNSGVVH